MEDSYEVTLAQEIERIVSSPYPTQLKHLRDLVSSKECSEVHINRCIAIKSCRINRLATCLLDGLAQWPYVLDIITRLACNLSMRDALIDQRPNLIHDVIAQAIKSDTALRSRYADAAVVLLMHPLDPAVTLPSNVQNLFIRLVQRAVKQPSTYAVRSIYLLLKGTSTLLLGLLDRALLWEFEQQMVDILKLSAKKWHEGGTEPKLSVYCLAIMAIVVSETEKHQLLVVSHGSWDSQDLLASTQGTSTYWDAAAMREYFSDSKKGSKTLHLLVVQISADLSGCDTVESFGGLLEFLNLANEIVPTFSVACKQSYKTTAGDVISKMQKKALLSGLDLRIRLLSFCFAVQLSGADGLLSIIVDSIRECIGHPTRLIRANNFGNVSLIDHLFDIALTSNTTTMLLQSLFDHLANSEPKDLLESQTMVMRVMSKLQSVTEADERVAQTVAGVVAAASTLSKLQDIYDRLVRYSVTTSTSTESCLLTTRRSHSVVVHSMCQLFLQNALRPEYRKYWDAVPAQNMEKLLEILDLASCGKSGKLCEHHTTSKQHPGVIFAEETSTPTVANLDWRLAIEERMGSKAQDEQQAMLSIFAQACADLEARCATAEEPLRKEMQKRETAEEKNDELTRACKQLEEQVMEFKLRADGLESESENKDEALQHVNEQVDELNSTITRLQMELDETKQAADAKAAGLREAMDSAALEHAATVANKQHLLEDALRAVQQANDTCAGRDTDIERLQEEMICERAETEALQQEVRRLQGLLADKAEQISTITDRADTERAEAQRNFESHLQRSRDESDRKKESHEQQIQEVKRQARESIEASNASHNDVLERLSAQHGEEIARFQSQLSVGQDHLRGLEQQIEDLNNEMSESHQTVQDQHRKIERLEKKYKAKDDEVKAQIKANNEWRSKVLLTMGLPIQPSSFPGQAIDTQMEEDLTPPTPASDPDRPAHLSQFRRQTDFTDDTRSPIPKRVRKSAKGVLASPSKVHARFSLGSLRGSARQTPTARTQRQPLNALSSNQIRRMSVPEKALKSRGCEMDAETVVDDETEYDGSEIFTGTQQEQMTMDFDGL